MPGTFLDAGGTTVNNIDVNSCIRSIYILGGVWGGGG